jgi:hypothetical protein
MQKGTCHRTVFVHDQKGNDLFDGTFENPMKTIQSALFLTRNIRTVHGNDNTLCITIRGGTYYLGTNATTTSSQIGAIALTSNDSNLVIENYPGEIVALRGETLLQLQWSVHALNCISMVKEQLLRNIRMAILPLKACMQQIQAFLSMLTAGYLQFIIAV